MNTFWNDVRYALRVLRRSPGFAAVAVLTLALGIGATTAIFSVIEGVLLRPLPYPEPDELVRVFEVSDGGGWSNFSHPNFEDVHEENRSFEALAEYAYGSTAMMVGDEARLVGQATVSGEFFDVAGVRPRLGRTFAPHEFGVAAATVAVVSHDFWQGALGGARDLSGLTLRTQAGTYAVVGVLPPEFEFPDAGGVDVLIPQGQSVYRASRTAHNWRVIGRLSSGVAAAQASQDLGAIAGRLKARYGDDTDMSDAAVIPLHEYTVGDVRPALLVLLGAAGFLLLIACSNVVNLLLSRMASRGREFSVRLALGAGARRLVQQFLAEALVLSIAGGVIGVVAAYWGIDALLTLEPGRLPRLDGIGVNATVLAFALGTSIAMALGLGLLTAWRSTRADARASLALGDRSQASGAASHRVRGAVVVVEVALTIVLLVGAGLLARSFERLLAVDPGYRTDGALVVAMLLPPADDDAERVRLGLTFASLLERLRAIPGVEFAGGVDAFPLAGGGANGTFLVIDDPAPMTDFEAWRRLASDPSRSGSAEYRIATADYFRAMGIPLVRGRLFDERDDLEAPHVAVISESLARTRWPDEDPIGKYIQFGNMDGDLRPFTIIGIVGDVRDQSLEARPEPIFYGNAMQRTRALTGSFSVVLRGAVDPASLIGSARRAARAVDPSIPLRFRTLDQIFSSSLAERRFSMMLLGIFALTALAVAAVGLYGVISYLVAQRTREIGIRMALGARAGSVLGRVIGHGAALAGIGVAFGIVAALALTRFLAGMLYGIGTTDPVTFAGIALLLGAVAVLASYVPARRATRVDPMVALRME